MPFRSGHDAVILTGSALVARWLTALVVMATPGVTVSNLLGVTLFSGMWAGFATELGVNLVRLTKRARKAIGWVSGSVLMGAAVWLATSQKA